MLVSLVWIAAFGCPSESGSVFPPWLHVFFFGFNFQVWSDDKIARLDSLELRNIDSIGVPQIGITHYVSRHRPRLEL